MRMIFLVLLLVKIISIEEIQNVLIVLQDVHNVLVNLIVLTVLKGINYNLPGNVQHVLSVNIRGMVNVINVNKIVYLVLTNYLVLHAWLDYFY
jgi:hypothetical protein